MSSRLPMSRRSYSTGNTDIDAKVAELVEQAGVDHDSNLITEIVTTAVLLARDNASRLDLKIINTALKEMRYAFKVFAPYRDVHKVSVFGSARSKPADPDYEQAKIFGETIAKQGWMVVTGAGPGSMAAANEGAGKAASFGVNIRLPFEAEPNPFIADDPKLINFKYFFTRKLMFMKESDAFVLLPGGFGTMDEAYELLTLIQTGKSDMHPIVLLDSPHGTFWHRWMSFVEDGLEAGGYISPGDRCLFRITDSVAAAVEELGRFYRNYHSMRFVGETLILRVQRLPGEAELAALNAEFADSMSQIRASDPARAEVRDAEFLDLPRIAVEFDRAHYGRLRQLIDRLNEL